MALKKGEWILLIFNLAYIIGFTIFYIIIKNFEFLLYIGTMVILFVLIVVVQRKVKFSYLILWLLTIWGVLHMIGGGVVINDEVVYKLVLFNAWGETISDTESFTILKYDQFVHAYLYFVMVFVIWHLIKGHLKENPNFRIIYPILVLTSIGIGALNEIIEFTAVLIFPETGVGGYYNTAWDIVFNAVGAILGVITLHFVRKRKINNITNEKN